MSKYSNKFETVGCVTCIHFFHESIGDYGAGPYDWGCDNKTHLGNLKSFPFKKKMKCHELDFWHSEFAKTFGEKDDCDFDEFGCPIWETSKSVKSFIEKYQKKSKPPSRTDEVRRG